MQESMIQNKTILHLQSVLLFLILPLVFYYIYVRLLEGWDNLENYTWSLNLGYFVLSVLSAFLYFVFTTWIWHRVLTGLGSSVGFWRSFRVLHLAQMGKYLPGNIWAVGGQLYLGKQEGISPTTILWATGIHWYFNLLSGAIIFLPLLYSLAPLWVAVSVSVLVLFVSTATFFLRGVLSFLSRWPKFSDREGLYGGVLRLTPSQGLGIFFGFALAWSFFGLSFWALINTFVEVSFGAYYTALASFCGAWVMGVLSFFAPAGIGVREGALVYLLGQFLVPSMAAVISIAARLWITLVELICAAVAWFIQ